MSTLHSGGAICWTTPELLDVFSGKRRNKHTVESDMYALSMPVITEVGGSLPIELIAHVHALSLAVQLGYSFR